MNPANALSQLSPGMAECHARLMAVAKHGTPEAFSATLAGVLQRAELSISNAYDAGAKSIQVDAAAAPNATTEFIKAFREYLTVHPNIKLGGHEADTVARELALIAQPAVAAGCTRSHPHENMDSACRARAAIAEMRNMAARGAEATAHDLDRFVSMLTAAPPTTSAGSGKGE